MVSTLIVSPIFLQATTRSVRDTLGCTASKQYFLEEPDYIQLSNVVIIPGSNNFDGSIKLNVIGGTPPFTYEWKKIIFLLPPQEISQD